MRIYYFILLLSFVSQAASSQVFPVQVNAQLFPPYSPYLSDYTAPGSQKFMVQVRGNDLALTDYRVKLRITIEGVNITIRTKPEFVPQQPIIMQGGGIPQIFYGEDLAEYFHPNALDFAGITRSQYQKGAKLPEGLYRFTIEVQDYNRHTVVSNKSTTMAWIILNDPPILNLPRNDSKMRIFDPSNIVFSWTPRHTGSPNAAFTTEYTFRLVEVWPLNRNPYDAFLTQPALYEVFTSQTQIVYGLAEPALIPGRKYAWQVQAKDMEGRDLFKNQGKSEVFVFQFGDALGVPENFSQQAANSSTLSLRWDPATTGEMPDQYRIRYKPVDRETWYETVTQQRWSTLSQLPANTEYDVQIRAEKGNQFSEYSPSLRTNTTATDPNEFSCGIEGTMATPGEPVASIMLTPGDVFYSRNFRFVITNVKNVGGSFDGEALMPVPWFNGASVKVNFAGVRLDANYELVAGAYNSVYNPGSELTQVVDEMHGIGEEKAQEPAPQTQTDSVSNIPTITYLVPGIIDSVYVNEEGKIEVVDEEGNTITYERKKDGATGEVQETVVADSGGNTYTIGKSSDVNSGASGTNGVNTSLGIADTLFRMEEQLITELLAGFKEEIRVWLENHGKGPLDDTTLEMLINLATCLPEDEQIMKAAQEYVNETENNPEPLVASIRQVDEDWKIFEGTVQKLGDKTAPYLTHLTKEENNALREIVCKYIVKEAEKRIPEYIVDLQNGGIRISYKGITGTLLSFQFNTIRTELSFKITDTRINQADSKTAEITALFQRAAAYLQKQLKGKEFVNKNALQQAVWSKQEALKKYLEELIEDIEQSGLEDLVGLSDAESTALKNSIKKFKDEQGIDPAVTVVDETLFDLLRSQYESGEKKPAKDVHLIVDKTGKNYSFFYRDGFFTIPVQKTIESTGEVIQLTGSQSEIFAIRDQVIATAITNDDIQGIGKIAEPTLNIFEKGMWVIKVTKETLAEIKVPVPMWNKNQESTYPFNLESTVAGIGDGIVDEFKSLPDLLLMCLSMFDKQERDALINAVSSINLETLQAIFEEKGAKYMQGGDVASHEGGYDVVQIASIFWGGVLTKSKKATETTAAVRDIAKKYILDIPAPTGKFRQLVGKNGSTFRAADFWKKVDSNFLHKTSSDGKYLIKHDPTTGRMLFVDAENKQFIGFALDEVGLIKDYDKLFENLKTIHGLPGGARNLTIKGININLSGDRTTVIFGKHNPNAVPGISGEVGTDDIINELGILKNYSFADETFELRPGSVHVLNIPDAMANSADDFFDVYNKDFVDMVIRNKDKINPVLVSDPRRLELLNLHRNNNFTGTPTGFAKEIKYLRDRGVKNVSLKDGTFINLDDINLDNLNWTGWKY